MSEYEYQTIVNRVQMLYDDLCHELMPVGNIDLTAKAMWHLHMTLLIFQDLHKKGGLK